jgi:hypothetical protein
MRAKAGLVAILLMSLGATVRAGDYTYDLPQLVGHYLGDTPAVPTYELAVDLGLKFAQIDGAALRLTGTHAPGLIGDLNSPNTFELPAEIIALFDGPDMFSDVFIDERLPSQGGAFALNAPFRVGPFAEGPPDFSPWLAGTAEFQFSIHSPPTLAIYYLIDMPSVTITSATLVIEGQSILDAHALLGDFDGSGLIDGHDLLAWQRNPGVGSLSSWQTNYGRGSLTASLVVPEPNCLILVFGVFLACRNRSRRTWNRN